MTKITETLGKDEWARCQNCEFDRVHVPASTEILMRVTCPSCETELVVTSLDPLQLEDYHRELESDEDDLVGELLEPVDEYEDYGEDEEDW